MSKIEIEIPIPNAPGARVDYEVEGDQIKSTLYYLGIEVGSETFKLTEANEEGFGYARYEKNGPGLKLTFEIWIRWKESKIVLVVLYKTPFGKGKKEVWGDF